MNLAMGFAARGMGASSSRWGLVQGALRARVAMWQRAYREARIAESRSWLCLAAWYSTRRDNDMRHACLYPGPNQAEVDQLRALLAAKEAALAQACAALEEAEASVRAASAGFEPEAAALETARQALAAEEASLAAQQEALQVRGGGAV